MIRIFLVAVLICSVLLTGGLTPPSSCAAELSRAQMEELLDKAQTALLWFHSLGNENVQARTAAEKYREKISPPELIQAAALLHDLMLEPQTALAEQLLVMLPHYRLTPEEMFEINDLFAVELRLLAEIETPYLGSIPVEADRFRRELLNSAEKVVLFQEPETALEVMKAVDVLSVVGRPVLVRHYLRRLLAGTPATTPEESAKIVETIGTQKLMQLAVHPEFVPLGKEAVAMIIDSAKEHWQDKERIAEALREFVEESGVRSQESGGKEPGTEQRAVPGVRPEALPALRVLWKGDQLSVQQVFEKLATIENEQEADQLVAVLLSLRADMKEALAAVLNNGHYHKYSHRLARGLAASVTQQESFLLYFYLFSGGKFIDDESEFVQELKTERNVVKNILAQREITLPSQQQAAAILFERATDYIEKRRPLRLDTDGKVSFWEWDFEDVNNVVLRSLEDIETAYLYFAYKYYEQSYLIAPQNEVYEFAFRMAACELGQKPEIVDEPMEFPGWPGFDSNVDKWERFLQASLEKNRFGAVSEVASHLGRDGNADLLQSTNGRPRVLVQAVVAPNREVRFAALEAIMKLTDIDRLNVPFAGSSLVADTLVWFSQSDGESVLLSGHPQMATAVQTANLFLGLGYKTDVATTCRDLFRLAAASPDVEMIVADARTPQPPVGEFVQRMRQDARTAEIPIAILSSDARELNPNVNAVQRNTMTEFDRRQPDVPFRTSLSLTYPLLANEESARWVHDDLIQKTVGGRRQAAAEERLEMAKQALRWLREIKLAELSTGTKIYHFEDFDAVVLNALHSERRVSEGLQLAAAVKSSALQLAIYEVAANGVYPMWLREQAGEAFEESIERFGILLRGVQIQRLYDRYNASESEPVESQELLGRLIDVVEEKEAER